MYITVISCKRNAWKHKLSAHTHTHTREKNFLKTKIRVIFMVDSVKAVINYFWKRATGLIVNYGCKIYCSSLTTVHHEFSTICSVFHVFISAHAVLRNWNHSRSPKVIYEIRCGIKRSGINRFLCEIHVCLFVCFFFLSILVQFKFNNEDSNIFFIFSVLFVKLIENWLWGKIPHINCIYHEI